MEKDLHSADGARKTGIKLALLYFVVATTWILLGDRIALAMASSPEQLAVLQSAKGVFFVIITTMMVGVAATRLMRAEAERRLAQTFALTDPVTQLPNARAFYDALATEISHHEDVHCALLLIDFRDFSRINNSFGRPVGDQALFNIGRRLRALANRNHQVTRLEEDKFAVLLATDDDPTAPAGFADKIIERFNEDMRIAGQPLPLDLNIGYACYPEDGDNVAALLDAAELALKTAKDAGHNTAMRFRGALLQSRREHFHLESELRLALNERGLSLNLQPQYELATGKLIGAEALVRWHHRERGLISPAIFIPVAEQSGLIDRVGEYVLDSACRALSQWREQELPSIKLAVNVAGHQLDDQRLGFFLMQAAEEWDIPLSALEIEVTESMAMQNPEQAVEVLAHLRQMGISVALDDFGTGYSSLSYLLRLPVDKLKIDRSFISELPGNQQQLAFVRTLVGLGKDLGVTLVAEGIETEAQRELLLELGCHLGQGYLLGRPMEVENFSALLHGTFRKVRTA